MNLHDDDNAGGKPAWRLRQVTRQDERPLSQANLSFTNSRAEFTHFFHQMWRWQENGRCVWLVVDSPAGLVGSGQLLWYPHTVELANIIVAAPQRRQGVGHLLVTGLLAVAAERQVPVVEARVRANNGPALAFYQRLSFQEYDHFELLGDPIVVMRRQMRLEV